MSSAPRPSDRTAPTGGQAKLPGAFLRERYQSEFERIRCDFEASGDGLRCAGDRARAVDRLILTLWESQFSAQQACVALAAVGGYGRGELVPHSDVDLLFLAQDDATREAIGDAVRSVCQQMWDSGLRVSPVTRTLAECGRLDHNNVEFTLSLLSCRFLAGDVRLFEQLYAKKLPELIVRESDWLLQSLSEITAARHARFGDTIFHLEPNVKDGPGGLRDCHVAQWAGQIAAIASGDSAENDVADRAANRAAIEFLSSARCHLHYSSNRDDNTLHWGAQEQLAARGMGSKAGSVSAADWMRQYYAHAKAVSRHTSQLLDQAVRSRSSLFRSFQHWRSRVSNSEFTVVDGRIYFQQAADARDVAAVLRLFVFIARHGVSLSGDAERRITGAYRRHSETMPQDGQLWPYLCDIMTLPHAAHALRTMHSLNLLSHALPEFEAVNLLVLRDLYHRYTVDEHTLLAIDVLHRLKDDEGLRTFAELLAEVEHPELLYLALLLHDTGKGLEGSDHVYSSLQFARTAVSRLQLPEEDASTVCFLVGTHLEMSSTLRRRDIYDPATIAGLAAKTGTPERLKMLTLLTLADIKAVNPEALTPWKAENLWRLYTATATYFDRSADKERASADVTASVLVLQPLRRAEIQQFLDGLPQRYILSHPAEQVLQHFRMSTRLAAEPVQLQLLPHAGHYELTLVTADRSGLFSLIAGVLYGWGMDITRAAAFSNRDGIVVDSFYFKDRFRTLALNPSERDRFQRSIADVLTGESPLHKLLASRLRADQQPVKLTVETRIRHDNESSEHNSLLEIVTQDRPGLLHTVSSLLTQEGCSIEVALIDTEGPLAHDVFYVTLEGRKLTAEEMRDLEWALAGELSDSIPTW